MLQDVMSQWYRGKYSPMDAVLQDAPQVGKPVRGMRCKCGCTSLPS